MQTNATKKMGLFSAVLIGVTSMVGSGWLFSAQLTAKMLATGLSYHGL